MSSATGASPFTVTVIVCTRDRADMLREALTALRSAVPADVDILVVDSASRTAATRVVAERAGVRYVRSDVPGLSIARNLGIESTDRDIVVFTDDDCAVAPGFLVPLLGAFAIPAVAAATGLLRDDSTPGDDDPAPTQVLRRTTEGLDAGHGALMAFRRSALGTSGGFDPVLGAGRRFGGAEDMDAFCRMLRAGHALARVPASLVTHLYTRTDEDYIALNESYGRGIGAMCEKWLRTDRRTGLAITAIVARRGIVRYARRWRRARTRRGQSAYLTAIVRGFREARALPVRAGRFVDEQPPAPVTLSTAEDDTARIDTERLPA